MDISQNRPQMEMCMCYNCSEQGHILPHCLKPWKQWIQSTTSAEVDIKGLVAKLVAAALAQDIAKKAEKAKGDF